MLILIANTVFEWKRFDCLIQQVQKPLWEQISQTFACTFLSASFQTLYSFTRLGSVLSKKKKLKKQTITSYNPARHCKFSIDSIPSQWRAAAVHGADSLFSLRERSFFLRLCESRIAVSTPHRLPSAAALRLVLLANTVCVSAVSLSRLITRQPLQRISTAACVCKVQKENGNKCQGEGLNDEQMPVLVSELSVFGFNCQPSASCRSSSVFAVRAWCFFPFFLALFTSLSSETGSCYQDPLFLVTCLISRDRRH